MSWFKSTLIIIGSALAAYWVGEEYSTKLQQSKCSIIQSQFADEISKVEANAQRSQDGWQECIDMLIKLDNQCCRREP